MKKLSKVLALAVACLMLLGMTACTSQPGPSAVVKTESASAQQSAAVSAEPTAPPASPEISGNLLMFVASNVGNDMLKQALATKYPDLKIEIDAGNVNDYETILKTRLSAGDAPDIMTVWPGSRTSDYAQKGYLLDISDMACISRVPETLSFEFSYNGGIYAMCYSVGGEGMYYNKDMFAQQGLQLPTNFEEFQNVCKAFMDKGIQPLSSGYAEDWVIMRWTNSVFATLGYGRDPNFDKELASGAKDYSFEGWKETFNRFRTMLDAGYFGKFPLSTDNTTAIADFATGKTAMMIHTSGVIADIRKASPDINIGFTATPVNDKGEQDYGCWKSGLGYAISKTSKNIDGAKAVFETFCDPTLNQQIYASIGSPTVLKDVKASNIDPSIVEFMQNFVDTGHFSLGAHDRWPAGMSNNWKPKLQEFVGSKITTDQMVEWLNTEYKNMTAK